MYDSAIACNFSDALQIFQPKDLVHTSIVKILRDPDHMYIYFGSYSHNSENYYEPSPLKTPMLYKKK